MYMQRMPAARIKSASWKGGWVLSESRIYNLNWILKMVNLSNYPQLGFNFGQGILINPWNDELLLFLSSYQTLIPNLANIAKFIVKPCKPASLPC